MNLSDYQKLYDSILEMSFDIEGIPIFTNTTKEDIEKCQWIAAMLEVFNDVPKRIMNCMFKHQKIEFDYIEFIGE